MNEIVIDDPLSSFRLDDRLIVIIGSSAGLGDPYPKVSRVPARPYFASEGHDRMSAIGP